MVSGFVFNMSFVPLIPALLLVSPGAAVYNDYYLLF